MQDRKTRITELFWERNNLPKETVRSQLLEIFPQLETMRNFYASNTHKFDLLTETFIRSDHYHGSNLYIYLGILFSYIGMPNVRTKDELGTIHYYGYINAAIDIVYPVLHDMDFSGEYCVYVCNIIAHDRINIPKDDARLDKLIREMGTDRFSDILEMKKTKIQADMRTNRSKWNAYARLLERIDDIEHNKLPNSAKKYIITKGGTTNDR